jgi:spore maturation protein CgeB
MSVACRDLQQDVLVPGREVLVADGTEDVMRILRDVGEDERRTIAARARTRILAEHTATRRAETFERLAREVLDRQARRPRPVKRTARSEAL